MSPHQFDNTNEIINIIEKLPNDYGSAITNLRTHIATIGILCVLAEYTKIRTEQECFTLSLHKFIQELFYRQYKLYP